MPTLEITPEQLAKKSELIDVGQATYDWNTQTRLFRRDLAIVASTCFGADTSCRTQCGQMFSDDPDTD